MKNMQILSPSSLLSEKILEREHQPLPASNYRAYRACLRWEFSFCCAFCCIHETDLSTIGVEGTGLTSVEHHLLKSKQPQWEATYTNLFYACKFCNDARNQQPVIAPGGGTLLEPTTSAWGLVFRLNMSDFRLEPLSTSAEYTERVYDINEPRRIQLRKNRYLLITDRLAALQGIPQRISALNAIVSRLISEGKEMDAMVLISAAKDLQDVLVCAKEELIRYRAIPLDAPSKCRCDNRLNSRLPPNAQTGLIEIDL